MREKMGLGIKHGVKLRSLALCNGWPSARAHRRHVLAPTTSTWDPLGTAKARLGKTTSRADLINPHIADGIIFNTAAQHEYQLASSLQAILFRCAGPQPSLRTVLRENRPKYTRILWRSRKLTARQCCPALSQPEIGDIENYLVLAAISPSRLSRAHECIGHDSNAHDVILTRSNVESAPLESTLPK